MHKYEVMVLPFTCGHTVVFHTSQAEKHSFPEWKLHSHRKLSHWAGEVPVPPEILFLKVRSRSLGKTLFPYHFPMQNVYFPTQMIFMLHKVLYINM
jgi:hypothetical protein